MTSFYQSGKQKYGYAMTWVHLFVSFFSQYSWCQQVFPEPLNMLGKLFSESLETLNPPLNQCLHSSVHRSQSPIDTLIDLRKVCCIRSFSSNSLTISLSLFQCVLRFVKQLGSSLSDTSESMIISLSVIHRSLLLAVGDGDVVYSLVEVVHIPYCQQLVQFGSLEQQLLMRKLNESKMVCEHTCNIERDFVRCHSLMKDLKTHSSWHWGQSLKCSL